MRKILALGIACGLIAACEIEVKSNVESNSNDKSDHYTEVVRCVLGDEVHEYTYYRTGGMNRSYITSSELIVEDENGDEIALYTPGTPCMIRRKPVQVNDATAVDRTGEFELK